MSDTQPSPPIDLAQMLQAAVDTISTTPGKGCEIARTSCRIPQAVLVEVGALAQQHRMSVSLLVNLLLDAYLLGQGRPGYAELAPWYVDYVLRKSPSD